MVLPTITVWITAGLLAYASANARYTGCKDGWLPFKGSCYLFGRQLVHFIEAEHYCRQHDAHVIEVNSTLENAFVKDHLRDLKSRCFWLGLTDEAIETVWTWYTSDTQATVTDWYPGDPGKSDGGDCSVLWPAYDFKWGDLPCTATCAPLCKTRGIFEPTSEIIGKK